MGDDVAVTPADITERLRAVAQAEGDAATTARADAEAANRARSEFLATMSHDRKRSTRMW